MNEQPDHTDRIDRTDHTDHTDHADHADHADQPDHIDYIGDASHPDHPDQTHRCYKPTKIGRTEVYIIYISAVITFIGFLTLWFYLFVPQRPIVLNQDIQVEQASIVASGARTKIVFALNYCKDASHANQIAEVHYTIKDGLSYDIPGEFMEYLPSGCHIVREIIMVPELSPGRYQLEMYRFYRGPLRETLVRSISNFFDIKY